MDGLTTLPPTPGLQTFILAGGLGTRLRALSGSHPKAMMPVAGEPFLSRLLRRLAAHGIARCVLCLGYGAHEIIEHYRAQPISGLRIEFSVESEPRGTAGALRVAERFWASRNLILNGDTELDFNVSLFCQYHQEKQSFVTVGLVQVDNASRYGRAVVALDGRLLEFLEKDGRSEPALVNAGVYLAERVALEAIPPTGAVSVEADWLPGLLAQSSPLYAAAIADRFIDIGTPADYQRLANHHL